MEINLAKLASEATEILKLYLPFLLIGGKEAAQKAFEKVGKKFVEATWERAESLWEKFKPRVEGKPSAKEAIEEFVRNPGDEDALPAMRQQIKKILAEDPSFAAEISIGIENFYRLSIQVGDGSVVIPGHINESNIISGNRNVIAEQIHIFVDGKDSQKTIEREIVNKAYRTYLEKLSRYCNSLPLAALGRDESPEEYITLDGIYIDRDTTEFKETVDYAPDKVNRFGVSGFKVQLGKIAPISVMKAASESKRLVLLGDAGAGKSTFIKKLLALQAAVLLGERKEPIIGIAPELIPVLINLRDLKTKLAELNLDILPTELQKRALSRTLLEKIRDDINSYKAAEFIPELEETIEKGKILLALDGLDEVPQGLRGRVRHAVSALIQTYNIEHIIITCRSRSYTGIAEFKNFRSVTIAPFNEEKIGQFAHTWYNEQHRLGLINADQAEKRANDLANVASTSDLIGMSSNPMMLTSIAIIHQKGIVLSRERVLLYHLIVDVMMSRWQKYKTGEEEFAPSPTLASFLNDTIRMRLILEVLAYETHRLGIEANGNGGQQLATELPRSHALTLLEKSEYLGSPALASEFLDYVVQRAGLLTGEGSELERPTSYYFPYSAIQEYLAGCYLIGKRNPEREIYNHAAKGEIWNHAVLMGAEELLYNRRGIDTLLDIAYFLCPVDIPKNEQDERSLLWSGQMANIVGIENIQRDKGSPSGGNTYLQRLIPRTVNLFESRLTPSERASAGDSLAYLGDPRSGVIADFIFCEISNGAFLMGNTKETDSMSDTYETPQIIYGKINSKYYISRYPVTNSQFDKFVNDPDGYTNEIWWTKAGLEWRKDHTVPPKQGGAFDLPNHPIVNVSWFEAVAFTRWLTNKMRNKNLNLKTWKKDNIGELLLDDVAKWEFRLPIEAEWEKAARGERGLRYPWGETIKPTNANYFETGIGSTNAVGIFPTGCSPYGLLDMSGNVWEWCATQWTVDGYKNYGELENNNVEEDTQRVSRGGAFLNYAWSVRCAIRVGLDPKFRHWSQGFRVVVAPLF